MMLLGALGHAANVASLMSVGQEAAHHREQLVWSRRSYALDAIGMKVGLLKAARDEVRGTYDTYVDRLDTLLLLNGILMPFAMNVLQFCDVFLMKTEFDDDCDDCMEKHHPWIGYLWAYLVGLVLIFPFWALLIALGCKDALDQWLQNALADLQELRRDFAANNEPEAAGALDAARRVSGKAAAAWISKELRLAQEMVCENERVVEKLGEFVVGFQDNFTETWTTRCLPQVFWANRLLWAAVIVCVCMTGQMFGVFLINRKGKQEDESSHFIVLCFAGLGLPVYAMIFWRTCKPFPNLQPFAEPVSWRDALARTFLPDLSRPPPPLTPSRARSPSRASSTPRSPR